MVQYKYSKGNEVMKMKMTKANNYGRGFWFEFADGHHGWVLGWSAAEKKREIRQHGALVMWRAA